MQLVIIFAALDCITRDEVIVCAYDGALLGSPELIIAIGQLRIRCWFWALMSWEFFLVERTFHQVILVYGVLRDLPPHTLSFETIVPGDSAYATGSFDAYMDTSRDYATWFAESSPGLINGDVPVSGGRVLGGIICT